MSDFSGVLRAWNFGGDLDGVHSREVYLCQGVNAVTGEQQVTVHLSVMLPDDREVSGEGTAATLDEAARKAIDDFTRARAEMFQ